MSEKEIPQNLMDSPLGELIATGQVLHDISLGLYAIQQNNGAILESLPSALTDEELGFILPNFEGLRFGVHPIYTDLILRMLAEKASSDAAYLLHITANLLVNSGQFEDAKKARQLESSVRSFSDSLQVPAKSGL